MNKYDWLAITAILSGITVGALRRLHKELGGKE